MLAAAETGGTFHNADSMAVPLTSSMPGSAVVSVALSSRAAIARGRISFRCSSVVMRIIFWKLPPSSRKPLCKTSKMLNTVCAHSNMIYCILLSVSPSSITLYPLLVGMRQKESAFALKKERELHFGNVQPEKFLPEPLCSPAWARHRRVTCQSAHLSVL